MIRTGRAVFLAALLRLSAPAVARGCTNSFSLSRRSYSVLRQGAGEIQEIKEADESEELERQVAAPPQMRGLNMTYLTARRTSRCPLFASCLVLGGWTSLTEPAVFVSFTQELDQATGLSLPKAPPTSTDLDLSLLSAVLQSAEQARERWQGTQPRGVAAQLCLHDSSLSSGGRPLATGDGGGRGVGAHPPPAEDRR